METDTENRLAVAKTEAVEGRDGLGVWDEQMQTSEYRINKQQGPAVEPSQLYSISCDYGKEKKSQNKDNFKQAKTKEHVIIAYINTKSLFWA